MPNASEQKKRGYNYRREDLYTAIVFINQSLDNAPMKDAGIQGTLAVLKYRNIDADKLAVFERFKKFLRTQYPGAKYMNLYGGETGDFIRREYL